MFKSLKESVNRNNRRTEGDLIFSVSKNGKSPDGDIRRGWVLRLTNQLMARAHLYRGDKVDILIDEDDRTGMIVYDPKGWTLSVAGGKSAGPEASCTVQVTYNDSMPDIAEPSTCEVVTINKKQILFAFPETAVFKNEVGVQHAIGL